MCVLSHGVCERVAQVMVWNNISTANCFTLYVPFRSFNKRIATASIQNISVAFSKIKLQSTPISKTLIWREFLWNFSLSGFLLFLTCPQIDL